MKKALALILALIMLCSSATLIAFAVDEVAINIEEMPGYEKAYIGKPIETPPVQDGTIGDDEYTFFRQLRPYTANKTDITMSGYTNPTTEYWAYDADYIYYAYSNPLIETPGAQIKIRLEHDYVIGSTLTTFAAHRQLEDANGIQIAISGTKCTFGEIPEGKSAPASSDVAACNSRTEGTGYTPAVTEFKISRAYLAAQMGLANASDVTKFTYSTYGTCTLWNGSAWIYLHLDHLLTEDQKTWLTEKGVTTSLGPSTKADEQVSRLYNMVVLGEDPYEIDLKEFYDSNGAPSVYVGKALADGDTKPIQNGVIANGEYQKEYVVNKDGTNSVGTRVATRSHDLVPLYGQYRECISHDKDWIYIAFEFVSGTSKPRFYWNLSFIDSFKFTYNGGSTIKDAFTQKGHGINDGWFYGGGINGSNVLGHYSNAVTAGKVPSIGSDVYVVINEDAPTSGTQVYEFKISKAWYAAQVGIAAEDVRDLAWVTLAHGINSTANSYTQIGHHITDGELTALEKTYGKIYTMPTSGASHPYDNASLPRLFILDEQNTDWEAFADKQELSVKVKPVTEVPVIDGVIGATEYPTTRTTKVADLYNGATQTELEGTEINEYFGHDAEYIYYALSFKQTSNGTPDKDGKTSGRAVIVNFKPTNTFDVFNDTYKARSQYQARYNEDKDGNTVNFTNGINVNGGATWNAPVDEIDMFFAAEKDRDTNIKTYEFKISKKYIATVAGVELDEVKVVPYYTSFHDACMLGGTFTSDLKTALAVAGGSTPTSVPCYNFMSFEDGELLKVEDRLAINTQEEASIRLSPTNSGLRFKSIVSTVELKALMSKYDHIKVGTIIAPEDFDLTLQGILANNEKVAGTDYINVKADINTPIGHDRNINVFAGSITNLKENNIARNFAAVGYIAYSADGVNWTYVYSEVTAVRSAAYVAHLAIESGDYAEDATALEILNGYAAKYVAPEAN